MAARLLFEPILFKGRACGLCMYPESDTISEADTMSMYKIHALMPEQTHSLNVGVVKNICEKFPDTDALVTFVPDIPIGVKTADCVPILLYASDVEGVAAIHAGWKGSLGGIVDKVLDILEQHGATPENMKVAFGPSISAARYEVDNDFAINFMTEGFGDCVSYPNDNLGNPHVDLQGVNMKRLLRRGVKRENIHLHGGCTYDTLKEDGSYRYQSHRRSGGSPLRNLTAIILI